MKRNYLWLIMFAASVEFIVVPLSTQYVDARLWTNTLGWMVILSYCFYRSLKELRKPCLVSRKNLIRST